MKLPRIGRIAFFLVCWLPGMAATLGADEYPGDEWVEVTPAEAGMDAGLLEQARQYAETGGGSGFVTRHGKRLFAWGDLQKTYDLKSTSKSIGVTALGLAMADRKLALEDLAGEYMPEVGTPPESNRQTGWLDEITIRHLATQTAGFAKPGGFEPLLFRPGTQWHYSDGGPNWLADCVTRVYGCDIETLMFDRVLSPIGITERDLRWRQHAYRPRQLDGIARREFGSGVHANVDAMARIGLLYLRQGRWKDRQLIPASFVRLVRSTDSRVVGLPEHPPTDQRGRPAANHHGNASDHYGLLWWNNVDGTLPGVPRDAYWSWGLYDSLIVVIPSLDLVVSRAGKSWERNPDAGHYDVLQPFLEPIVSAVQDKMPNRTDVDLGQADLGQAPYPASRQLTAIEWAPASSIVRLANGSDNWPSTWADDGHLYTAYGDGWGFQPRVEQKLSLGLARIAGDPPHVRGQNLRSDDAERLGQGKHGLKASGMLCVDETLYMWVRNAGNSQLAWSTDHGETWEWAHWKFTVSFGCPTFLNFGRELRWRRGMTTSTSIHMIRTARTSRRTATSWHACRGHESVTARLTSSFSGEMERPPFGTSDIESRGLVFEHRGRCYRSGISYNAGLGRYLWCQVLPESSHPQGQRFEGGFGVYESRQPWGPWATLFFTEHWDVGPGETSHLPTKWMSSDGLTVHLLFSGEDHFSVRKGTLREGP